MAIATSTPRAIVADLFPEFLTKRAQPFTPVAEERAKELGISRLALIHLGSGWISNEAGVVTRAFYHWRSPYLVRQTYAQYWDEVVQAGFAEPADGGWRITSRGMDVGADSQRRFRAFLRTLPLPAEPTRRAAAALVPLAARIPPAARRAAIARRVPVPADEPRSPAVDLDRTVNELWSWRDDCHIGAWEDAGYDGPTLDVLTQVWSGKTTGEDVVKALEVKQERAGVERNLEVLVAKGEVSRDGDVLGLTPRGKERRDAIEAETDRRHLAIWDLDGAATARLGDDLRAVIDAIPT
ncbi:MAG: hypothetical protein AAB284_05845 [Chloroflexota bacterium]